MSAIALVGALGVSWLLTMLIMLFIVIFPMWRIVNKAGLPGPLALLMIFPVLNIVMLWVFAFVKWPVEKTE